MLICASQLWIDAVIDPIETRKWISMGIEVANHSQIEKNLTWESYKCKFY